MDFFLLLRPSNTTTKSRVQFGGVVKSDAADKKNIESQALLGKQKTTTEEGKRSQKNKEGH